VNKLSKYQKMNLKDEQGGQGGEEDSLEQSPLVKEKVEGDGTWTKIKWKTLEKQGSAPKKVTPKQMKQILQAAIKEESKPDMKFEFQNYYKAFSLNRQETQSLNISNYNNILDSNQSTESLKLSLRAFDEGGSIHNYSLNLSGVSYS
jgi:hypothetical protein